MRGDGLRASQDGKAPGLQLRPRGNYDNPGKIQNAKTGKKKKKHSNQSQNLLWNKPSQEAIYIKNL